MGGLIRRLGIRGGAAVGLVVLVVIGIVIGRGLGAGSTSTQSRPGNGGSPIATVDPTAGDDDEVATPPVTYPDDSTVRSRAKQFIAVWLRHDLSPDRWHATLAPLATAKLSNSLVGVDPETVPASRETSDPVLSMRNESLAQTTIAVDTGIVTLTLLKQNSVWLVDAIDWTPA